MSILMDRQGTAKTRRLGVGRAGLALRLLRVLVAGIFTALAAGLVIGLFSFAQSIAGYDVPAPLGRADAIVALTGGAARIPDAVELLERGHAERLLITGVHPGNSTQTLAGFAPGRDQLFTCCIDLGYTALNTVGNAKETRNWARSHGYRTLIVVTSSYHLPRSLNELRREMPEAVLIPHAVVADHLSLDDWWRDPDTTRLLISEYAKYLMSLLRLRWRPSTTIDLSITTATLED